MLCAVRPGTIDLAKMKPPPKPSSMCVGAGRLFVADWGHRSLLAFSLSDGGACELVKRISLADDSVKGEMTVVYDSVLVATDNEKACLVLVDLRTPSPVDWKVTATFWSKKDFPFPVGLAF